MKTLTVFKSIFSTNLLQLFRFQQWLPQEAIQETNSHGTGIEHRLDYKVPERQKWEKLSSYEKLGVS